MVILLPRFELINFEKQLFMVIYMSVGCFSWRMEHVWLFIQLLQWLEPKLHVDSHLGPDRTKLEQTQAWLRNFELYAGPVDESIKCFEGAGQDRPLLEICTDQLLSFISSNTVLSFRLEISSKTFDRSTWLTHPQTYGTWV